MFAGEARSLPLSEAAEMVLHLGRLLASPANISLGGQERLARDKRFGLLRKGVTYSRKKVL